MTQGIDPDIHNLAGKLLGDIEGSTQSDVHELAALMQDAFEGVANLIEARVND